ncbi:MAG: IS1595 family transposase [bacterium]
MERYTVRDFERDFPDDAACLEWLKNYRWPEGIVCENKDCPHFGTVTNHYRVHSRPSYSCAFCGHHVHPTADTIFHKSTTSLKLWFHAVYMMSSTRCGVSAKQIERQTGVTYKTAWRMWAQIRKLLSEDPGTLSGEVEVDETYVGGRRRYRKDMGKEWRKRKQVVAGQVERGGKVRAVHVTDGTTRSVLPLVREYVLPSTIIYTDELPLYRLLADEGYAHRRINHTAKIYVEGDVHTNTIEGFFSLLKRGISGVYHSVSAKYLQRYLDEYAFRYNHRKDRTHLFKTMLRRVSDVPAGPPFAGLLETAPD